jgi:coenzyme F420-reducing hydrogenase alpha subunit
MADLMEELFVPDSSIKKEPDSSIHKPKKKEREVKAELAIHKKMSENISNSIIKKESPNKGYKYPAGQHWTQKPENKNKLKKVVTIMTKTNKAK